MTIQPGLCQCGCGRETGVYPDSNATKGVRRGEPKRFIKNHHRRGPTPFGRRFSSGGYVLVLAPDHPRASVFSGSVFEHILVAEKALGHHLPVTAVVHHVNGDKTDNRPENLVVLQSNSEHIALHRRLRVLRAGGDPHRDWICASCKGVLPIVLFYRRRKNNWVNAECKPCERARRTTRTAS